MLGMIIINYQNGVSNVIIIMMNSYAPVSLKIKLSGALKSKH